MKDGYTVEHQAAEVLVVSIACPVQHLGGPIALHQDGQLFLIRLGCLGR